GCQWRRSGERSGSPTTSSASTGSAGAEGFGHADRLDGLADVVRTDHLRSGEHRAGRRSQRTRQPATRISLACQGAAERLARGTNADGPAQGSEPAELREHPAIPFMPGPPALAKEPEPWIDHDRLWPNAGAFGDHQALPELSSDHVDRRWLGRRTRRAR